MANNINITKADAMQNNTDKATAHDTPALSKNYAPYAKPELVELEKLFARDNSGGPDYPSDTGNFGAGGDKKGQGIGNI